MSAWMATTLLVAVRLIGMVFIIPGLSLQVVPLRTRALLVLLLAIPVLCVTPMNTDQPSSLSAVVTLDVLHEFIVGFSLGLMPAAMIWGLQLSTRAVNGMTGLPGSETTVDGLSTDSAIQRFVTITALAVFFLASGHRQVVQAVLQSFDWLPAGQYAPMESTRELIVDILSQSFALGVRAITPIAMSLVMSMMVLAAINRIMPQIGYFAVGLSFQTLVLLGSLVLFVGGAAWLLDSEFHTAADRVGRLWQHLLAP